MHSGKNLEIIYENIVNKGWSYSSVAEHLPSTRPCDQSAAWQFTYLSIYLPIHPSTYPSIHLSIHPSIRLASRDPPVSALCLTSAGINGVCHHLWLFTISFKILLNFCWICL